MCDEKFVPALDGAVLHATILEKEYEMKAGSKQKYEANLDSRDWSTSLFCAL